MQQLQEELSIASARAEAQANLAKAMGEQVGSCSVATRAVNSHSSVKRAGAIVYGVGSLHTYSHTLIRFPEQVVQLGQQVREAEAALAAVGAGAAAAMAAQKRALQDVAEAQAMQHTIAMEEVRGGDAKVQTMQHVVAMVEVRGLRNYAVVIPYDKL